MKGSDVDPAYQWAGDTHSDAEPVDLSARRRRRLTGRLAAIDWATSLQTGNPTAKSVLKAMAWYIGEQNNECWPSQKRLTMDTDLSERAVRNAIALLVEVGLVECKKQFTKDGRTTSNIYILRLDRSATVEDFDEAKIRMKPGRQEVPPQTDGSNHRHDVPPQSSGAASAAGRHEVPVPPARGAGTPRHEVPPKEPCEVASEGATLFDAAGVEAREPQPDRFEEFWDAYEKKVKRKAAKKSWDKAMKGGASPDQIINAARLYIANQKRDNSHPRYTADPSSWLNDERWNDAQPQPQIDNRPEGW